MVGTGLARPSLGFLRGCGIVTWRRWFSLDLAVVKAATLLEKVLLENSVTCPGVCTPSVAAWRTQNVVRVVFTNVHVANYMVRIGCVHVVSLSRRK